MTTSAYDEIVARLFDPQPWVTEAACRGMGPDVFYPTTGNNDHRAKAICETCPVRVECGQYATDNGERHGIWAGESLTPPEKGGRPRRPKPVRADPTNSGRARPDRWKPIKHGERSGYRAELRRGLNPCAACLAAEVKRVRQVRANRRNAA